MDPMDGNFPHSPGACPACAAETRFVHAWVYRCLACGLEAARLSPGIGSSVGGLETLRRRNFNSILHALNDGLCGTRKRLLEIGCASGLFLEAAKSHGYSVIGIEPSDSSNEARAKNFEVLTEPFFEAAARYADDSFDIIVFNDVFEHLSDPAGVLAECSRLLADDGRIVINLPVNGGILYSIARILRHAGLDGPYDRMWQKEFSSPHLFYYSDASLVRLLEKAIGFRLRLNARLRSTHLNGMWKRVLSGADNKLGALFTYVLASGFAIVEPLFPADIKFFIFEKKPT